MTRVLFIPVSGGHGSGEVQRCRLLGDALRARWPAVEPHALLATGTPPLPWQTTWLSASPTRAVPEVVSAALCSPSQDSQAGVPCSFSPPGISTTARRRPMVAICPLSLYANGASSSPRWRRTIASAT